MVKVVAIHFSKVMFAVPYNGTRMSRPRAGLRDFLDTLQEQKFMICAYDEEFTISDMRQWIERHKVDQVNMISLGIPQAHQLITTPTEMETYHRTLKGE